MTFLGSKILKNWSHSKHLVQTIKTAQCGLSCYFQCSSCKEGGRLTNQYVSAGDAAEPQVLHSSLLEFHVSVAQLAVGAQDILDGGFDLWKQVDELDVGGQQQRPSRHRAQVEFGVQEVELDQRAAGEKMNMQRGQCPEGHYLWQRNRKFP